MHPTPFNENARLEVLQGYQILDTEAEPAFDRIAQMAKGALDCPVAIINLADEMRTWFKSLCGMEGCEAPREVAFCAHTVMSDEPLIVPDATLDQRFRRNPMVTGEANVRFYAGAPILSPLGFRLGSVCVVDTVPRPVPDPAQIAVLKSLAAMVTDLLEMRRAAGKPDEAGYVGFSGAPEGPNLAKARTSTTSRTSPSAGRRS